MFVADDPSRQYLNETKEELLPEADVKRSTLSQHLPMTPDRYKEFQKLHATQPYSIFLIP